MLGSRLFGRLHHYEQLRHISLSAVCCGLLTASLWVGAPLVETLHASEVQLSGEVRAQMDSWQLESLNAADEAFATALKASGKGKAKGKKNNKKNKGNKNQKKNAKQSRAAFQQASAAYEAFLKEFPQSHPSALAYALYRQGRALHMDNKRSSARRLYQDVIEFFPNQIEMATSAIYYHGKSYQEDGDVEEAIRSWGRIARDKQYRQLPLAAEALLYLGQYLLDNDRIPDGVGLFHNMVTEFRTSNPSASSSAIDRLIDHFVKTDPNEDRLADLYLKARGLLLGQSKILY